jgi:hypothetical protein
MLTHNHLIYSNNHIQLGRPHAGVNVEQVLNQGGRLTRNNTPREFSKTRHGILAFADDALQACI